jgi:hypothetical protein
MAFLYLKVLLGTGHFEVLGAQWQKTEGAEVAGHHHFVTSSLLLFYFLFGHVFYIVQHFLDFKLLYKCSCHINIAGRKHVWRHTQVRSQSTEHFLSKILKNMQTKG